MNLNNSRVQLGLSDMTNSNILSANLPNEREVLSFGIWNELAENIFTAEKYFWLFTIIFLPFPFYFSILLHLHYTTITWKYKEKCSKEASWNAIIKHWFCSKPRTDINLFVLLQIKILQNRSHVNSEWLVQSFF